ncbi:hypothetical protein KY284_008816 [Solanum tuberosum]|nr:hypothetical protein KY284_008816 [Solanum tuberosum]
MHRGRERTSYIPFLLNPETRSDVIPVRLHFCETIPQARQPISHRRVCVNNGMVNITHFKLSHGDIISFQENDARTRGEEIKRSFYIEISVEKIIGKFLDHPWRRTKTEWFRLLKTKRGCRLLLKSRFLQQLRSSMQEEDLERTKKFGSEKGSRRLKGGGEGSRTSNRPGHIKNSRRRERFEIPEGRRTMILSVLSSPALVSGLMVVRAKNPVHSVLFLIPVFRNTSGLLLLLGLDFFAMIFPVVYIGAIAVSFLFVVMMFHIQIAEIHEEVLRYLPGMPTRSHESFSRYPVRPPDRSSLRGSTQAIALPPLLMLWLTPQADSSNPTLSKEKKSWDYDLLSAGLLVVIGWTLSSSKVLACKDKMTLIFTSMEPDVSLSPTDLTQKESMGVDTSIAADAEEEILALRAKMLTLPWKE